MIAKRLDKLTSLLNAEGFDGAAINPGPTLFYLTGLSFHLMERPVVFLVMRDGSSALVLPELEQGKVISAGLDFILFPYGDNPATWDAAFRQAAGALSLEGKKIGLEAQRLRVLELGYLQRAARSAVYEPADGVFSGLRMEKDEDEISKMRKAVKIAENALKATLPFIQVGVTEREIAAELYIQLLKHGSDSEVPFQPIVSGGPNGANPHAVPSERALQSGDLLVIDWGAAYEGYFSDLTRTFGIRYLEAEFERIYQIVQGANAAGRRAGKAGIAAGEIDRAAREVIEESGYGEYFIHRTGHGLGLEGHEHPYMYGENELTLKRGMVYTVEPGIYLPGRGGVRIEDDIVVRDTGSESLSEMSRELIILDKE